ncbi:MAG TPA: helix-hairpin-helix domain-containing protein [Candidatus Saccharimonadales bacterium]|nr:helix-hairpin-helix domain-containing protein [Candidatus Saccharimonadales bacterium]
MDRQNCLADLTTLVSPYSFDVTRYNQYIQLLSHEQHIAYDVAYEQLTTKAALQLFCCADQINDDPDKYIQNHIKDLKDLVDKASDLYYNTSLSPIKDDAFDALEYHLKKQEKINGKKNQHVGSLPIKRLRKQLLYQMPSLTKIKPGDKKCTQFIINHPHLVWSLKLNGVSGMAIYQDGKLIELNTRGNGIIGGDISHLIHHINIPKTLVHIKNIVVRGEFIITKENATKLRCIDARAFVSGKINSTLISDEINVIDYIVYDIINLNNDMLPNQHDILKILKTENFNIVEHGILTDASVYDIMTLYKQKRQEAIYDIDGLVLTINEPRPSQCEAMHHDDCDIITPKHAVAFKMFLESQMRITKVVDVEWNITRYGRYFPVVIYKPIYIHGTRLQRATGHNAKHIKTWPICMNTIVHVVKSGDIIPQIKFVDNSQNDNKNIILPKDEFKWHWEKCDIVLDDIDHNEFVKIKRIYHFFRTIGVKQFGEKTAENMYKHGFYTIESIVHGTTKDFMKIPGIGKKKAENFVNHIVYALKNISPDKLILASTTFGCHLGRKTLKQLFRFVPRILHLTDEDIINHFKKNKYEGFGPAKIKKLPLLVKTFNEYITTLIKNDDDINRIKNHYIHKLDELEKNGINENVKDKTFLFTSFMFDQDDIMDKIEDYIYDHRGKMVKQLNQKVNAVVYGHLCDVNAKLEDAAKLSINILSLDEFLSRYLIML